MENIYITILTAPDDVIRPNNKDCTSGLNKKNTLISTKGMASNWASSNEKNEIATNTSNLHLTIRLRVELESSLQGHLKALSKLTRGIERANHHTDLLQSAVDNKRLPRGLMPKVTPKIPDTPRTFTIEREDSPKGWIDPYREPQRLLERQSKKTRARVSPY